MKKITQQAINAFLNGKSFKSANTKVEIYKDMKNKIIGIELILHNNTIAYKNLVRNELYITNCGWFSNTTKERLNALPNVRIQQKKGIWYLNGVQWDGKLIEIK